MPNNSKKTFTVKPMGSRGCMRLEVHTANAQPSWKSCGDGVNVITIDMRLPTEINIRVMEVAFPDREGKREVTKDTYGTLDLKTSRALYELLKDHFEGERV